MLKNVKSVSVHEAKTHLSRLLRRVQKGEEVIIANAGKPVARLVAIEPPKSPRNLGRDRGVIKIHAGFDDPLDPETFGPVR
jgi:prevent-host-death family protein